MTKNVGLLINSSRGIIYASNGEDFTKAATIKAEELQKQMVRELDR
jgi:orotidine-5'-phosphate decarboxylase